MTQTGKKVLIVEDSKNYLFIISQKLSEEGFIVTTAEDGEEGLAAAKKDKPDLILLDIEMPKMDGLTVAKKLREENIQIPIIFLTNLSDLNHISEATETASEYIIKSDITAEGIAERVKTRLGPK